MLEFVAASKPAGGAALGEVFIATGIGAGLTALLLGLVYLHRTAQDRGAHQGRARRSGTGTGVPPWVALPTVLTTLSLLIALFGMMWDISLHIGVGRDPGPLANPAHYFILFGLFGVFSGGVLACAMPLAREARTGRRALPARLGRADRRHPRRRCRLLRPARLPARRHLAPDLRPGRHALGPDPPDAHHRRRHVDHRAADPGAGGPRRPVHRRRRPQGRPAHPVPAPGLGDGRAAAGHVGVPGRVRLRRPAVPAGVRALPDRLRLRDRAGRGPACSSAVVGRWRPRRSSSSSAGSSRCSSARSWASTRRTFPLYLGSAIARRTGRAGRAPAPTGRSSSARCPVCSSARSVSRPSSAGRTSAPP